MSSARKIPVIVGPTASGKSELGIKLAMALQGEIVNLDSIQVYRGVYAATAKVPPNEQQGIPHHLVDIAEPTENFTAGRYAELASQTIADIESRNKTAILVGGTGFYLRALVDPLFDSPTTDLRLRDRLVEIRDRHGAEHLHRMLARVDDESARRISARDWSRTMRALEYYFQTQTRLSEARHEANSIPEFARRVRVIVLDPPRTTLYDRINRRADQMFDHGLVEEVESLIASGVPHDAKAFGAHGYRRVIEYLQGKRTREGALNQMKLDTRHYAKRQLTWWRAWSAKGSHDAPDNSQSLKWIYRFGDEGEAFTEAVGFLGFRI